MYLNKRNIATRMYICESVEHPSSLLSGLNEQRLKGMLCDITVRVQGHLFKAHVNVLASAMGYFRDLFRKSPKDKYNGLVEIPMIVNSTGFAKILDFIYTSQLCISQSTVMQVLCSACYLQIPYVVEKCQDFITTHGHVTSPSSLSEVTAPLLDLQRRNYPKSATQFQPQSASASLSLLSQLSRLSEKSRARPSPGTVGKSEKTSPHRLTETDEQQECELINTPPSPGERSNGEERGNTPDLAEQISSENLKVLSLKQERPDLETSSNEEKQSPSAYSPQDGFSTKYVDEKMVNGKKLVFNSTQQNDGADHHERDPIDHQSLAEYFSSRDMKDESATALTPYPFQLDTSRPDRAGQYVTSSNSDHHIYSMSENLNKDRTLVNTTRQQPYSCVPKKEKPKKEYRCEYCGKMFGRQQHLKRHILTHTGERPYPCQYCDKRFRRSEHLKHHLANHEQAMGVEILPKQKKPRKSARANDAYSFSKLMLTNYNHAEIDRANAMENGAMNATPVILPSMFTEAEPIHSSPPSGRIPEVEPTAPENDMEISNSFAPSSGNNEEVLNDRQGSPSYVDDSPMTALNLCRVVHKDKCRLSPTNGSGDTDSGNGDELKSAEGGQNSPMSGSISRQDVQLNNLGNSYDQTSTGPNIIGMEGSEVLTSDLKRLIAAMDE
ncbi:uncharacterized protein LOC143448623 isoform X2 [Clavelina lepadiformis]|uniref:uncharacterized protein LOC143448623 isoform X2 n=1 Tax=Clavelina lepadiformis TaxID=159417 RepID=UPI004040F281